MLRFLLVLGLVVLKFLIVYSLGCSPAKAEEKSLRELAQDRCLEMKVAMPIRVNGVQQVFTTGGVVLRENLILTGAPAKFPMVTFTLQGERPAPARIIGWVTPENLVAILYGQSGVGQALPKIRLPVQDEKVLCVGLVDGKPVFFPTRIGNSTRPKPVDGHFWISLEGVFPGAGTAFGVYAESDNALVGLYLGKNNSGPGSFMLSLEKLLPRLQELKPVLIKLDWSGGRMIARK